MVEICHVTYGNEPRSYLWQRTTWKLIARDKEKLNGLTRTVSKPPRVILSNILCLVNDF